MDSLSWITSIYKHLQELCSNYVRRITQALQKHCTVAAQSLHSHCKIAAHSLVDLPVLIDSLIGNALPDRLTLIGYSLHPPGTPAIL